MKKIFNLAVILATLMGGVTLTSCEDEDKAEEKANDQRLESITVKEKGEYSFSNETIGKSGFFKVTKTSTDADGNKIVTFEITTKKDDAKGSEYTLGDDADHTSYLMYDGTTFKNVFQNDAVANADKIVFCLSSEATDYVITSATVNKKVKESGATKTLFAIAD